MKKNAPYTLNIDMSLSEDMNTLACKSVASVQSEIVLASMLAGAVVAMAHDLSIDPHKFAEAVCGTIMEFIDKPGFTSPSQKLS
jgi:hypothetical protein|nr:MAG TPA: hypothetical protein [Caudoviricetes sp.]